MTIENISYLIADETLHDGAQASYVQNPNPEQAISMFKLMCQLGIDDADIGFAANPAQYNRILEVAQYRAEINTATTISCASRALLDDITPIINISQTAGVELGADIFINTNPYVVAAIGWDLEQMQTMVSTAVNHARNHHIPVMMVTESTFNADHSLLETIYLEALNCGASRVCLCDTEGGCTPDDIVNGIFRIQRLLKTYGFENTPIDVHCHDDLGFGVANAWQALLAGANRVHATMLQTGERKGNADLTSLLLMIRKKGIDNGHYNLTVLPPYARLTSEAFGIPIPRAYPGIDPDSRVIVSGVHASALDYGLEHLCPEEAGQIYLPVNYTGWLKIKPSHHVIVGPSAGKHNVLAWGKLNGHPNISETVAQEIIKTAQTRALTDKEIHQMLEQF